MTLEYNKKTKELRDAIRELPIPNANKTRLFSALMKGGITSLDKLRAYTAKDLLSLKNIGSSSVKILIDAGLIDTPTDRQMRNKLDKVRPSNASWISQNDGNKHWFICSSCGQKALRNDNKQIVLSSYCPECGARMR